MRLIDADALKELFSEVIGHIAKKPEMNGNLEHMIRASAMVIQMIDDAPTVEAPDINVGNMDAISRQQAFDALRTCYDTETITMENGDEYINYGDAVGEIEQLPSVQPVQRWIPCSERLPENDDDVLVQMNDGSMMVDCRAASSNGWFWAELGDEPVAWMPLPEPYQGGGDT